MATVRIRFPPTAFDRRQTLFRPPRHKKVVLRDAKGDIRIVLPYAPREVEHAGFAPTWQAADRVGQPPLLRQAGKSLRTVSLELLLARPDHQTPVEDLIAKLSKLARTGRRCRFRNYGDLEGDWWRITDLAITTELRQFATNRVTRARAGVTLTRDIDDDVAPIRRKGKKRGRRDDDDDKKGGGGGGKKAWPKSYVVKKGDTLSKIAERFYGDPDGWRHIADANGIRDPRNLKVGRKLRIPRPKDDD